MTEYYDCLCEHFRKINKLQHLQAMAHWDQAAMMPAGANNGRAEALAELAVIIHGEVCSPQLADWFSEAEQESLSIDQQASLREMKRSWRQANALPMELVQAKSLTSSRCEHAWRSQRLDNDWQGFAKNLEEIVSLSREEAQIRGQLNQSSGYDALLQLYEPGMSTKELDVLFTDLDQWLPDLIQQAMAHSKPCVMPKGPFAISAQKALGHSVMSRLGFDFNHGRLDESTHPFCGGVPEDVRITTRYYEADFSQSLMGVIHETGHACYEQGLPHKWRDLPVGKARSMGIHESQSLLFEMQIGRHPAFIRFLIPLFKQYLGEQAAFTVENMQSCYTKVSPGFIRVDADELTYPAHIMLRYEIERDLIDGHIQVADIPERWDLGMRARLGLATGTNYKDGCMQDIHWTDGSFGYFPSYTLGAIYAAQLFAGLAKAVPDLEKRLEQGDMKPVHHWLKEHIWQHGSYLLTSDLIESATGSKLDTGCFRRHLEQRYLGACRT